MPLEMIELGNDRLLEPRLQAIGTARGSTKQRPPALDRERVLALEREIAAGEMQLRERFPDGGAMSGTRPADPHAVEEGDDGGRSTGEAAEHLAAAVLDRLRAGDAARGKMLHQAEKERQVVRRHPPLIKREDEISGGGVQQKV